MTILERFFSHSSQRIDVIKHHDQVDESDSQCKIKAN